MAGFQTHIAVSSTLGLGFAWWTHTQYGLPWSTAAVTGGLCAISGMLPDLDSDTGVPFRETVSFAAAVVPMMLFNKLHRHGLGVEQMILAGAPLYLLIRFGLGSVLKAFTVHRGMFHSLPATAIAGLVAYLVCDAGTSTARMLKAVSFSLGYLSHLILDEIWSVEVNLTGTRLKSSSGTALKFFARSPSANVTCYALLFLTGYAAYEDWNNDVELPAGSRIAQPGAVAKPSYPARRIPSSNSDMIAAPSRNIADPRYDTELPGRDDFGPPPVVEPARHRRIYDQARNSRYDQ